MRSGAVRASAPADTKASVAMRVAAAAANLPRGCVVPERSIASLRGAGSIRPTLSPGSRPHTSPRSAGPRGSRSTPCSGARRARRTRTARRRGSDGLPPHRRSPPPVRAPRRRSGSRRSAPQGPRRLPQGAASGSWRARRRPRLPSSTVASLRSVREMSLPARGLVAPTRRPGSGYLHRAVASALPRASPRASRDRTSEPRDGAVGPARPHRAPDRRPGEGKIDPHSGRHAGIPLDIVRGHPPRRDERCRAQPTRPNGGTRSCSATAGPMARARAQERGPSRLEVTRAEPARAPWSHGRACYRSRACRPPPRSGRPCLAVLSLAQTRTDRTPRRHPRR